MGKISKLSLPLVMIATVVAQSYVQPVMAGAEERRQAHRIHVRLTGVTPTNAAIDAMETRLLSDPSGKTAAEYAIDTAQNPNARYFYNVTLKNWIAPWTNEEQTVFTDLNDYTATAIGLIRDGGDFRQILHGDIIYRGIVPGLPPVSNSNNNHYRDLEDLGPIAGDLSNPGILQGTTQSSVTGLPAAATAGVMTTRAAAMAFFFDGTNRAMFRFTMMNHMCSDLEPLKDTSRTPDRVRRDVSRSPGGDSRIFLNTCVGCHAGMDGMSGAFAHYEWVYTNDQSDGRLVYRDIGDPTEFDPVTGVAIKHNINANNFEFGYETTDDTWINYWRNGQNWLLGWNNYAGLSLDTKGNAVGRGAKELGLELANSTAFAQCQVDKAFKAICLRDPNVMSADRAQRNAIRDAFMGSYNGDMREVFTDVAAYCRGS